MRKTVLIVFISLFCTGFAISQTYIILTTVTDTTDGYYQAVKALRDYRSAQVVTFDPANVDSLIPVLSAIAPRYVALVMKPPEININFVRKFLVMSTMLDDDPFSDFSYGYITGATAQDALNFVNNIIYAETHNIQNFPLNEGGYAASSINAVYSSPGDFMTYLNPPVYSDIYMETSDSGTGIDFFLSNSSNLENKKLLDIGYNGDPHMLWLFDGGNSNPNPPVWNYDSAKIEDTAYARVGLTSYDIGALNLYPAVAYNGACHSGEPKKVMVEEDIAATFGDCQGLVEFYTMSDTFSFALSILKTGITGYFAPCGANNANDQGEEVYNTFLYQEPLGDIFKRSIDGVVMGFLGNRPNLRQYVQGESTYQCDILSSGTFDPNEYSGAYSMLGGKANRIYFGDPLYNPFINNHSNSLNITQATLDSVNATTLDINLAYHKPDVYFPVWDKFHFGNTRIYLPVELPSYCGDITSFEVLTSSDTYNLVIHAVEHFDGKTILHIEVDIPNDMYSQIDYTISFRIMFVSNGIEPLPVTTVYTKVYPDPADGYTNITFFNPENSLNSLFLFDSKGELIRRIDGIKTNSYILDTRNLESGLYFFRLTNENGLSGKGKFVVE